MLRGAKVSQELLDCLAIRVADKELHTDGAHHVAVSLHVSRDLPQDLALDARLRVRDADLDGLADSDRRRAADRDEHTRDAQVPAPALDHLAARAVDPRADAGATAGLGAAVRPLGLLGRFVWLRGGLGGLRRHPLDGLGLVIHGGDQRLEDHAQLDRACLEVDRHAGCGAGRRQLRPDHVHHLALQGDGLADEAQLHAHAHLLTNLQRLFGLDEDPALRDVGGVFVLELLARGEGNIEDVQLLPQRAYPNPSHGRTRPPSASARRPESLTQGSRGELGTEA